MGKECTKKTEGSWMIGPGPGRTGAGMLTDCIRCRSCEAACSFWREGKVNPALSRIRVIPKELEWIMGESANIVEVKVCRQCPGIPPCMLACPVDAIERSSETGAGIIDDEKCIRCGRCVEECPYDAIWHNKAAKRILKCDLCGGQPKCIEWCPVNVLKYTKIK